MHRLIVLIRCFERIVVVLSGVFIAYLGYLLYAIGVESGQTEFSWQYFVLKGAGPGLAFMGAGVCLLWRCLATPIKVSISDSHAPGNNLVVCAQGELDGLPQDVTKDRG